MSMKPVTIVLRDGEVTTVRNLPEPFDIEVHNYDQDDPSQLDSVDADGVRYSREQFNPDWGDDPPPPMIELTAEDWVEVWAALNSFKTAPVTQGDDAESRRWRQHIQDIADKIGPDGIAAFIAGVAPHCEKDTREAAKP